MRLSRWIALIALMTALGCLKAGERTALLLQGYALAERLQQTQERATDVAWLRAEVASLSSPPRLARAAQTQGLKLVAWTTLQTASARASAWPTGQRATDRIDVTRVAAREHGASNE
jgi:hypothetical protein